MKEERLKENATTTEKFDFLARCARAICNNIKVIKICHKTKYITELVSPGELKLHEACHITILHEPKKEYVPYNSETAHLIPCGAWVEDEYGYKSAITNIHIDGSITVAGGFFKHLDPKKYKYCNSPVNGELVGKPFGFCKEVV